MNRPHPFSLVASALALCVGGYLIGCDSFSTETLLADAAPWSDHHCQGGHAGAPGCPSQPGNGNDAAYIAALSAGMDSAPQAVDTKRDNTNALILGSSTFAVQARLAATWAHASDPETSCVFEFGAVAADLHAVVREQLIGMLDPGSSRTLNLSIEIDRSAIGTSSVDHLISTVDDNSGRDYWLTIGKNNGNQYFGFPTVTVDGDDYVFTGGTTRTIRRVQQGPRPRGNDPVAQMRCPNLDVVVATLTQGA